MFTSGSRSHQGLGEVGRLKQGLTERGERTAKEDSRAGMKSAHSTFRLDTESGDVGSS